MVKNQRRERDYSSNESLDKKEIGLDEEEIIH
jgi:hypothetical protein